jgi:ACS family pantothenate transporter-like MFS transporter
MAVGYIVGQVPHGIAINLVAPRIWFPSMVIVWALLTMCFAACHNLSQILALRFLTGLVEASTYAGTQFIIGSW